MCSLLTGTTSRIALPWLVAARERPNNLGIPEMINTYRFADYKEKVIDLLKRATTVSVGVPACEPGWRW